MSLLSPLFFITNLILRNPGSEVFISVPLLFHPCPQMCLYCTPCGSCGRQSHRHCPLPLPILPMCRADACIMHCPKPSRCCYPEEGSWSFSLGSGILLPEAQANQANHCCLPHLQHDFAVNPAASHSLFLLLTGCPLGSVLLESPYLNRFPRVMRLR